MVSPLATHRNKRDNLASFAVPFYSDSQSGRKTGAGGGVTTPACYLIQRLGEWERLTPLQFIKP